MHTFKIYLASLFAFGLHASVALKGPSKGPEEYDAQNCSLHDGVCGGLGPEEAEADNVLDDAVHGDVPGGDGLLALGILEVDSVHHPIHSL